MKLIKMLGGLIMLICLSCQSLTNDDPAENSKQKWSIRMASAVMEQHPDLVHYNRARGKEKIQYDVAMMGMAIDKLGSADEKYSRYLQSYVDYFVDSTGQVKKYKIEEYNLDMINFAKNLITLYKRTGDERYMIAVEQFVRQIDTHPKTRSGGLWHKKIYEWQMWLDGSYMAAPFISQYAKEFNRPDWFNLATFQLIHIYEKTADDKTGLLYHAWDESCQQRWCDPATGRSKEFWGRSIGWYLMAVVDVLDYLPENHPERPELIRILNNVAESLLRYRDEETGTWYQVLDKSDRAGNYPEASCTAIYAYVFAKGAQQGSLPKEYRKIAQSVFDDMLAEFVETGLNGEIVIKNICGSCGLGGTPYRDGSYEYYITEKRVDNDPKGVGAFILAAVELEN